MATADICGLCGSAVNGSTGGSFNNNVFSLEVLFLIERKCRKLLHGPSCRLELQILKLEVSRVYSSVSSIDRLSNPAAYLCVKCQRLLLRRSNLQKQLMECIANIRSKLTLLIPNTQPAPTAALSFDIEQQPTITAATITEQPMGITATITEQPMGTMATINGQQQMGSMVTITEQMPMGTTATITEQQPMATLGAITEQVLIDTTGTITEQQPVGTMETISEQQPMATSSAMVNNISSVEASAVQVSPRQMISRKKTLSDRGPESGATDEQHNLINNSASPEIIVRNSNNMNQYLTLI